MGVRMRHVVAAAVAVALVASLLALGGCGEEETTGPATGEPYKIGAVVSVTGVYAGLGGPEKNTLEMEVARINEAGGVHGRPIEVIIEDDATDEEKAVQAATKLVDQDQVLAIIGATGTGQSMAIRDIVTQAGIPQLSMAGGTVITADFDPLVFQTPWSNTIVVPFALQHVKDEGITKVGLITDSGGFGKDGRAVIQENAPKFGIELVADEQFNPGDTDMTAQLTKIKDSGAEAILMWSAGSEAGTVAKNRQQLNIELPLYGSHGNARREFIEGAAEAGDGFVFPAGKVLIPEAYGEGTPGFDVATKFIDDYTAEFGSAPNTFAGHAYDALYIIVEAMKRLEEDFTAAELRDEIEKTSGWVGIGGTFTFSASDHNGLTENDLVMYRVTGGDWELVE